MFHIHLYLYILKMELELLELSPPGIHARERLPDAAAHFEKLRANVSAGSPWLRAFCCNWSASARLMRPPRATK